MTTKSLFFIAGRLCFSRKNRGIVHVISLISLIGVAVATCALLIVLSVFNGFTFVAEKMLEKENPPLIIKAKTGNTIEQNKIVSLLKASSSQKDNKAIVPVVKQTVMISVGEKYKIVNLIGTTDEYFKYNALDSCLNEVSREFSGLQKGMCLLGVGAAFELGLNRGAEKMNIPVKITIPRANDQATVVEDMLESLSVSYQGCFQTHSDLDDGYIFTNIDQARELLSYDNKTVNFLYDIPKDGADRAGYIKQRKQTLSKVRDICAQDLIEQEPVYFKIVKSEKLAVYVILSFIVFIATINIISSLIILYIQKQRMNHILRAIGASRKDMSRIYFLYGMTNNLSGCLSGLAIGIVFCLLQEHFGLIGLDENSFVVNAFPIKIMAQDIIKILLIVLIIGALSIRIVSSRLKIK